MSKRRKLTPDEKKKVERWAREKEQPRYPGKAIRIVVKDEVDENGTVHYETVCISEVPFSRISS
jgi:hypothetical protein